MPTSPPSCKCTTRRYALGRLRAVLCSSVWTPRSSVATLRAAIPRHPGLRLAQRGQDLTPSWRARPLQRSRTQLQLHGSVLLQVCGAPDWLRGHGTDHHARARGLAGPAAQDPQWASFAPTRPAPGDHPLQRHGWRLQMPCRQQPGCEGAAPTTERARAVWMRQQHRIHTGPLLHPRAHRPAPTRPCPAPRRCRSSQHGIGDPERVAGQTASPGAHTHAPARPPPHGCRAGGRTCCRPLRAPARPAQAPHRRPLLAWRRRTKIDGPGSRTISIQTSHAPRGVIDCCFPGLPSLKIQMLGKMRQLRVLT